MKSKTRLTIRKIEGLNQGEEIWDNEVLGLHIRALKTGWYFYLYYRNNFGQQKKPSIGKYGVITLETARKKAREFLATIAHGKDPIVEQKILFEANQIYTFVDLKNMMDKVHYPKLKSRYKLLRQWECYILPILGQYNVRTIERKTIQTFLNTISSNAVYNLVRATLSNSFNHAEEWGWREEFTNPIRRIKRRPTVKRRRYLRQDEVFRLGKTLKSWSQESRKRRIFSNYIRLLMYTGARRSEILHAKWDYIDWHRSILDLPDSKTGAKEIVLSSSALELLKKILVERVNDFIIPAKKGNKPLVYVAKMWQEILEESTITNLRIHDLRHSFASIAISSAGGSLQQVGSLLGHANAETTARYAHFMTGPKHALANRTSEVLDEWLG